MTSGHPPSGPSAMKLGGIALIGVGALAGVFGVATAVAGTQGNAPGPDAQASHPPALTTTTRTEPSSSQSPNSSQTSTPPTTSNSSTQPSETTSASPSPPETVTNGGGTNGGGTNGGASPSPPPPEPSRISVRVYNNSTITGLAHRAAAEFRAAGYEVPVIGNYSAGRIATTTIYYRPGTEEESQAREIANRFSARLEPRFPGIVGASPGVIAIITNDYQGLGQ